MGNPANPANGQQIIFQVTQGSGGSFTLAWGSAYEFSANLPQPTLSTAAGQTDLLGFIYNAEHGHLVVRRVRERIHGVDVEPVTHAHAYADCHLAVAVSFADYDDVRPAADGLPAVSVHQRSVQPGFL